MSTTIDEFLHSTMSLHSEQPYDASTSSKSLPRRSTRIRPLLKQKIELTVEDHAARVG